MPLRVRAWSFFGGWILEFGFFMCVYLCESVVFSASNHPIQITELTNRLRVEINGHLFTEYYFKDVPRPYCYPLIGPGGAAMTRNWPMNTTPDEEHDHPHQIGRAHV